jgi:hypothetical protein
MLYPLSYGGSVGSRPTRGTAEISGRSRRARTAPTTAGANYRLGMVFALVEVAVVALVLGLLAYGGWVFWHALQSGVPSSAGQGRRLPPRARAELAAAIGRARWQPGHDEVDGVTRILLRRSYTGLDGRPAVLEERVLESFPAGDPAWEALFTEAMAKARFRCAYLNAEELQ